MTPTELFYTGWNDVYPDITTEPDRGQVDGSNEGEDLDALKDDLYQFISDASKDATGCRLRLDITHMTVEELQAEADYWSARAQEACEDELARQADAIAAFEASVRSAIECGAPTRADAIRWLWEGFKASDPDMAAYGPEAFDHAHGLPYAFMAKQLAS
jgi:hypothetical protein